jgi:8-oxo-dGTP diphosphatase
MSNKPLGWKIYWLPIATRNERFMQQMVAALIRSIHPFDALEADHQRQTLAWIASGAPLFRLQKPAIPPQHLVAYFVLFDAPQNKLLLVDHKNAGLWLPSGGHVEMDEYPRATVIREAREELGLDAHFLWDKPLFLTVTETVGDDTRHIDVSLWYVLRGDCTVPLAYDPAEFHGVAWFPLDQLPLHRSDPHLARFVVQLRTQRTEQRI